MTKLVRKRLIKKIKEHLFDTDECITTIKTRDSNGYSQFQPVDEFGKKYHIGIHRFVYEYIHKIKLSKDIFVCHTCDNPPCINPKHLFAGTAKDNAQDMLKKGRSSTKWQIGKKNGNYKHGHYSKYDPNPLPKATFEQLNGRKLTYEQVVNIKNLLKTRGDKSLKDLAKELNIKEHLLHDINCGRTYKSVTL